MEKSKRCGLCNYEMNCHMKQFQNSGRNLGINIMWLNEICFKCYHNITVDKDKGLELMKKLYDIYQEIYIKPVEDVIIENYEEKKESIHFHFDNKGSCLTINGNRHYNNFIKL